MSEIIVKQMPLGLAARCYSQIADLFGSDCLGEMLQDPRYIVRIALDYENREVLGIEIGYPEDLEWSIQALG